MITVNSLEQDAVIYVDGAPRGKGAVSADVKRGKPHDLMAKKDGCQDVSMRTSESFDAITLLGALWDFGIVTVTTDLISGNAWKQEPATYTVTPICKGTTTASQPVSPTPSITTEQPVTVTQ